MHHLSAASAVVLVVLGLGLAPLPVLALTGQAHAVVTSWPAALLQADAAPTVPAIDEGVALIALAVTGLVAVVAVAVVLLIVRSSRRRK